MPRRGITGLYRINLFCKASRLFFIETEPDGIYIIRMVSSCNSCTYMLSMYSSCHCSLVFGKDRLDSVSPLYKYFQYIPIFHKERIFQPIIGIINSCPHFLRSHSVPSTVKSTLYEECGEVPTFTPKKSGDDSPVFLEILPDESMPHKR